MCASHNFAFVCNDTGGTVEFYIDGNLVATVSSGIPVSGTTMNYVYGSAFTVTGTAESMIGIGCIQIQSDY